MIKALRQTKKPYLSTSLLSNRFTFCSTNTVNTNTPCVANNVFNGYMLPVVYPIWVSSSIKMHLSPQISQHIKNNSLKEIAMLAYAPEVKNIDETMPLQNQFYQQATLCSVHYIKKHQYAFEPIRKIKVNTISKELQHIQDKQQNFDLPVFKMPDVKLNYQLPNSDQTLLFDSNGNIQVEQQVIHKENYSIYKLQGEVIPPPLFPEGLQNDVKFKMVMYFAYLSAQKHNQSGSVLFKHHAVSLAQSAEKALSLIQPFVFASMFRQRQLFPTVMKDIQNVFQTTDIEKRMDKDISLLYNYLRKVSLLQQAARVASDDQAKKIAQMNTVQIQQIIKGALYGKEGKTGYVQEIKQKFMKNNPPEEIIKAFNEQCSKYLQEDDHVSGNTKQYLQTLATIPYGIRTEEVFDINKAKQILNSKHYGMQQAKKYILEFIAVGSLKKSQKGKVLFFVGPPGVGKTTFATSVAEALGRKYQSISLGGVINSSTLKGHRRTYMQSMAGQIIQALRRCGTNNPVILLDEIDKMGASGYNGDPRSDLLEILDPNQNFSFVDNYVDHPVDLSNVLFICSANYIHHLSRPLLDRLQKIQLSSYTDQQKINIANLHILPKVIKDSGLKQSDIQIQQGIIKTIIDRYTYGEPGVRFLQKLLRKIFQKVAVKVVQKQQKPIVISSQNLQIFLDHSDKKRIDYNNLGLGVGVGLGQSEDQGGRVTIIEVVQRSFGGKSKKQGLLNTGNLGDILKQSVGITYTFCKKYLQQKFNNTYLYENQIHLHAPQGHSKKNGAGQSLTIAIAIISRALNKVPKRGIAVAGQLSLKGRIMHVYELKQKLLAAKRQGIYEIVLPLSNKQQVQKMNDVITGGLSIHYVSEFNEVEALLFQ